MRLTDDKPLFSGRKNFRLSPAQKVYAFVFVNLHYQELRPRFSKESEVIEKIIQLLEVDPVCPIQGLSERSIYRFLADARGRKSPGQWLFKRTVNPETGRSLVTMYEHNGIRLKYPHPSHRDKTKGK